jgi:transcriptional regulator with XRE-family HTH domain
VGSPSGTEFDGDFEAIKKIVGSRIRSVRKKRGISQEELAASASVDRKHMSEIETGKVQVGIWTLMRIAGVLEITAPTLLRDLKWNPESDKWGHPKEGER